MGKLTVACPHCGTTATLNVGIENGSSYGQCKKCHKTFRIYMKKGEVDQIKK